MNIKQLSNQYHVRQLNEEDLDIIYELEYHNPLYFHHCPPALTKESILEDMKALPPKKTYDDKYYLGFFDENNLVAVMDLILNYPNQETAFIGFFMMNYFSQGKGIGTQIIQECCTYLKKIDVQFVRLGYVKGNPQSEAFWRKNGFIPTGIESKQENYTVIVMEKKL